MELSVHIAISFYIKAGQQLPNLTTYLMSSSYSIWNTTTIFLVVDHGNFNMVRGNFHYLDRSTTITNTSTDPFNVELESAVTGLSTTSESLGKFTQFGFEASRALIYNDQHQISRYLLIPLLRVLTMIQIDPQALLNQVIFIIEKQVLT